MVHGYVFFGSAIIEVFTIIIITESIMCTPMLRCKVIVQCCRGLRWQRLPGKRRDLRSRSRRVERSNEHVVWTQRTWRVCRPRTVSQRRRHSVVVNDAQVVPTKHGGSFPSGFIMQVRTALTNERTHNCVVAVWHAGMLIRWFFFLFIFTFGWRRLQTNGREITIQMLGVGPAAPQCE